jgi:hypothetical protein
MRYFLEECEISLHPDFPSYARANARRLEFLLIGPGLMDPVQLFVPGNVSVAAFKEWLLKIRSIPLPESPRQIALFQPSNPTPIDIDDEVFIEIGFKTLNSEGRSLAFAVLPVDVDFGDVFCLSVKISRGQFYVGTEFLAIVSREDSYFTLFTQAVALGLANAEEYPNLRIVCYRTVSKAEFPRLNHPINPIFQMYQLHIAQPQTN